MSRKANPIEYLLKLKSIKPDIQFEGQDARTYQAFLDEQAEASLLAALQEEKEEKKTKKTTKKKKTVKKVKQTIDPEIVETGEMTFNETIDDTTEGELQQEEAND